MTQTFTKTQPEAPRTADQMRQLILNTPPLPHPLNGATVLHVHPDLVSDAERINEAAGGCLHIHLSRLASPKFICGFKGDECVLIIKSEK